MGGGLDRINEIRVSPHFLLREFQCRCCGCVKLSPRLLERLEALREAWGHPVVVTSGYRCAAHNGKVGGAARSLHMAGLAADVAVPQDEQAHVEGIARALGFVEILPGGRRNYLHLACK
ncbi:D-Ala-D-Ala carboxypeptidase family metallohydrolase [Synergistaceae bacterium OttesenSCG-928-I11]|nr:D-Ala-D-Ala carboxypeptidase family metallohydrolase [Synergistaceae bacterium OttesenSCG-928-I11]